MNAELARRLRPLTGRVRRRAWLESIRWSLLAGLGAAALLSLGGRLLGRTEWPMTALSAVALSLVADCLWAWIHRPDTWAVARAADGLGLAERVTSALHASQVGHPAADLLMRDASRRLAGIDPGTYPVLAEPRRWGGVLLVGVAFAVAAVAPIPTLGEGGQRAAEAQTVLAAREAVTALEASLPTAPTPEPLARVTRAEIQALTDELAQAESVAVAADALEEAQARLASQPGAEDCAWRRALAGLVTTWSEDADLGDLARTLATQDPAAIEPALADLAARSERLSPAARQRLHLALQGGANAARDVPALAGALRQAAARYGASAEAGVTAPIDLADLAPRLQEGVTRAAGLGALQHAVAGLGQARAGLGPLGTSPRGAGAVASGPAQGSATGGQIAASSTGSGTGSGAGSQPGSGGSGTGSGSGSSGSSGSGSGSGTGSGSGGSGGGAGAGAGAGGGPAPGEPGAGQAGATSAGGSSAPQTTGATSYDPVSAPSLLGGEGGPRVQAPGETAGASGATVETPDSPLDLGASRPYDQVYGEYETAARQTLARQSLPPALDSLVQRYFSSLAPDTDEGEN